MSKDELIRVLASMRTDLNAKMLTMVGVQRALDDIPEPTPSLDVAMAQLKMSVATELLNDAINVLNAKQ